MLLYAIGIIFIFLGLLFWNYGNFAATVVRWCKPLDVKKGKPIKRPPLTAGETVKCYIPIYQALAVRKALTGSYGVTLHVGIISGLLIIIRLINAFLLPINGYVMLATTFMMWIGLLLYFILYGVITFSCARMFEFGNVYAFFVFLFPQILCGTMSNNIADKMRAMHKEETFSEHNGDTVIKSRHR